MANMPTSRILLKMVCSIGRHGATPSHFCQPSRFTDIFVAAATAKRLEHAAANRRLGFMLRGKVDFWSCHTIRLLGFVPKIILNHQPLKGTQERVRHYYLAENTIIYFSSMRA